MSDCKCRGYNIEVLPRVATGMGNGSAATADAAKKDATDQAEGEATAKAAAQFGQHLCPPPCISIPIPRIVASGSDTIGPISEAGQFHAFGWAKAQLDVLCIELPVTVHPAGATLPRPTAVEPQPAHTDGIAPVGGGSRTR